MKALESKDRESKALPDGTMHGTMTAPEEEADPAPGCRELGVAEFDSKATTSVEMTGSGALPGIHLIFQRAADLLRKDEQSHTRRSNKDTKTESNTPLFPLTVEAEYWATLMESGHPLADGKVLSGVVRGLNHSAGFASADSRLESCSSSQATMPTRSTTQAQVEKRLAAVVSRNHFWNETDTEVCFDSFFLKRKVDYMGEEVKVAQRMTWAAIQESLPDAVGSLPLEKFCRLGTLEYVKNFEKYLVPPGIQVRPKPPRVMCSD